MWGRVSRAELVERLVELIASRQPERVLRVAVDGPDAAGKTTLADELGSRLAGRRAVIRAGIDGFHYPAAVRSRRGGLSPQGYYHDSFDYEKVRAYVLDPLGPGGDRRYRTAAFDYRVDAPVDAPTSLAPEGAALLFDGVFLLRPELRRHWDLSVFLDVSAAETLRRAVRRDADHMGGTENVRQRYEQRYLPGQRVYRETARPELAADVVIDNDDAAAPRILRWSA